MLGSDGEKKKVVRKGGFHVSFSRSFGLVKFLGQWWRNIFNLSRSVTLFGVCFFEFMLGGINDFLIDMLLIWAVSQKEYLLSEPLAELAGATQVRLLKFELSLHIVTYQK